MTKVLCIGAHNDEIMADMGGTVALLKQKDCELNIIALAALWNDDNLPDADKAEYRRQEQQSAEILGATFKSIGYREGLLFTETNEMIVKLTDEILEFDPDIIFIHWPKDNHAEHRESASVSYKALSVAKVRGAGFREVYAYNAGSNQTVDFHPDFAVNVTSVMPTVYESLMCFNQNCANGAGLCKEVECIKKFYGTMFGFPMCDTFKIVKFPFKNDDFILKQLLSDNFRWWGSGMYSAYGEYYF